MENMAAGQTAITSASWSCDRRIDLFWYLRSQNFKKDKTRSVNRFLEND